MHEWKNDLRKILDSGGEEHRITGGCDSDWLGWAIIEQASTCIAGAYAVAADTTPVELGDAILARSGWNYRFHEPGPQPG